MSARRAVAAVLASGMSIAACRSDESSEAMPTVPAPLTFVSGSRLRATFHEVDGVKSLIGWNDTQLGKPCTFAEGRCIAGPARIESGGVETFENDACTERVVSAEGTPIEIVILVEEKVRGCRTVTLHSAGERLKPFRLFARDVEGTCREAGEGSFVPGEYYRVGPAMDPASEPFVHATEENGPGPGRIVPRWRVADDGAREIIGAWDTERNELVSTTGRSSGKRWLPSESAAPVGEATCPGVASSFSCKPTAAFIGGDGCRDPEVFALGPPVDATACPHAVGGAYSIASKIPVSAFAEATRVAVGSGRVRLEMSAAGDPIVSLGFVDTEARAACVVAQIDDILRCEPAQDSRASAAFGDEACTQKAMVWRPSSGNCDASPDVPRFLRLHDGSLVDVGARIFAAWTDERGSCAPVSLLDDATAHAVTPLDPVRLAVVTVRTE